MDPLQTTVPIYVSEKSAKNIWQDYRVYPDRIQLRCWILLSTFAIPLDDIVEVRISRSRLFGLASWWGLKLDWADLFEHVQLHRKTGLFKWLRFTPDNPERFVAACQSVMRQT